MLLEIWTKRHWSSICRRTERINIRPQRRNVTTGNEKDHATVLLVCAGDGLKLRLMVIFKRKTVPKVENKHRVISDAQEKGRLDAEGMKSLACSACWDWGDEEACLFMLSKLVWLKAWKQHLQRKHQFSSNSWRIDLSSAWRDDWVVFCQIWSTQDDLVDGQQDKLVDDDPCVREVLFDCDYELKFV